MRTLFLLVVTLVAPLAALAQVEGPTGGASDSGFRAFLSEWERAQGRFINGDPSLWKQNASHEVRISAIVITAIAPS